MTTFLPLITDVPACDLPAPGDSMAEPVIVQLRTEDGQEFILPLSLAAAQSLVQLILQEPQQACEADLRATIPAGNGTAVLVR